jgi:hypothetical protein
MSKRIEIDGCTLRADRDRIGLSRHALIATVREKHLGPGSEKSLQSAEDESVASLANITAFAAALGHPVSRYVDFRDSPNIPETVTHKQLAPELRGDWIALYLEQDDDLVTYIVSEHLRVEQNGYTISGVYEPVETEHPDPDEPLGQRHFDMKGDVVVDFTEGHHFVQGCYWPRDRQSRGHGYYMLKIMRRSTYCEGFCTYFSVDGNIGGSLNIWVRKSASDFSTQLKQAKGKMQKYKDRAFMSAPLTPNVMMG